MNRSLLFTFLLITTVVKAQTVGFFYQTAASQDGYVMFAPLSSDNTYLIDKCGKLVHTWTSTHRPGQSFYLLTDGTLLRPGNVNNAVFNAGGSGGIIERFNWSSSLLWSFTISDDTECQHHDVCYLRNGNILAIVWELKDTASAISAGRNPSALGTSLWSEKIVELHPSGSSATIVWEWHVWDHLVQDFDASKPGYGTPSAHPELIDLNYYSGSPTGTDWLHINSIDYNPALDQVLVSCHNFSEVWVIDHSTSTAQAASHAGGTYGHGGDLLYRWGNPIAYGRGTSSDQKLFGQHNAHWITGGLTDSGKIMIFNNGAGRPAGAYSTVDVIAPPVDASGNYSIASGSAYLPDSASWEYEADTPTNFYGMNISSAQRLPNGNTIICVGPTGTLFEIDTNKNMAWKYVIPVNGSGAITQGTTPTQNLSFRCVLYTADYSGFAGQTLTAGDPIEINPLSYVCSYNTYAESIQKGTGSINVVNPFNDKLHLLGDIPTDQYQLKLIAADGRCLQTWHATLISGQSYDLYISGYVPDGLYVLQVAGSVATYRVKLLCDHN